MLVTGPTWLPFSSKTWSNSMVGLQCVFVVYPDHTHLLFVRSSGVLGLSYKNQLCLPTDYHSVKSLAMEDCDYNSSEIAYMGILCAFLFYVGHVYVYSSLEPVGWR